jgi:hypothetical protein
MPTNEFEKLLEMARHVEVSQESRERQRISFAYGNANIENEDVTRETVVKMAEKLSHG